MKFGDMDAGTSLGATAGASETHLRSSNDTGAPGYRNASIPASNG